jgi:hypothetical protein
MMDAWMDGFTDTSHIACLHRSLHSGSAGSLSSTPLLLWNVSALTFAVFPRDFSFSELGVLENSELACKI